ncbi:MAG: Hpt domain-containing protein, partial [Planctomycetales bacterium]|nr:Hpt domain-containing protein [Planctomycetales bacterium]
MEQMDEIVTEFLVESYENLDQLDRDLVALEDVPDDPERLASIFRTIHTIKGSSGFLAFPRLEHLTHVGENLLVPLRDGQLRLTNEIADGLLSMVDAVRNMLRDIEATGVEGEPDHDALLKQLEQLRSPNDAKSEADSPSVDAESEGDSSADKPAELEAATEPEVEAASNQADAKVPEKVPGADTTPEIKPPAPQTQQAEPDQRSPLEGERGHSLADTTVRLDVQLLDRLMNLVGELVLARNQILQFSQQIDDAPIAVASQRLNHITTEL